MKLAHAFKRFSSNELSSYRNIQCLEVAYPLYVLSLHSQILWIFESLIYVIGHFESIESPNVSFVIILRLWIAAYLIFN
jgi:hypothetical protein